MAGSVSHDACGMLGLLAACPTVNTVASWFSRDRRKYFTSDCCL